MKRAMVGILILTLVAGMTTGCDTATSESEEVVQEEVTKEETSDDNTQEEPEAEELDEAEMPNLTMSVISSESDIDYTSIEGLNLEPGSEIAVVVKKKKNGYWDTVRSGMEAAVKDINTVLGYSGGDKVTLTFDAPAEDTDVEAQINTIDTVLSENPAAICLAAIDQNSCQAQLETAAENGIPVVMLDSGVHSDMVEITCQTDNYEAGKEAARRLSEVIGGTGKVAVMAHIPTAQTSVDREGGFREEMLTNHPGITLLDSTFENTDEAVADQVRAVLDANPDLNAYFCTNGIMTTQVLEVLEDYPDRDIKVVAFDAGESQIEAIENGKLIGVIAQNPYGMGYATVVAAARAILDMPNAADVNTGYQWLDVTNIADDVYENFLYK